MKNNSVKFISLIILIIITILSGIFLIYKKSYEKNTSFFNLKKEKFQIETSPFIMKQDGVYKMWLKVSHSKNSGEIYYAESDDGINWKQTKSVLATNKKEWDNKLVGSPSVLFVDNSYMMWYRGDGYDLQQIGLAISSDGMNWKKYNNNPVFKVDNNSWDSKSLVAPHVIYDHGLFKLYYRGSQKLDQDYSSIGLAVSKDGIEWTRNSKNPILSSGQLGAWDDKQVGDPFVFYNDSLKLYQMWYSGESYQINSKINKKFNTDDAGYGKMIGYASSVDGVSWTKHEGNPVIKLGEDKAFDSVKVDNPFVLLENNTYKMWYRGALYDDKKGEVNKIGYAVSKDGVNWEKIDIDFDMSNFYNKKISKNIILVGWDGVQREHLNELIQNNKLINFQKYFLNKGSCVDTVISTGETETKSGWSEILTGYSYKETGIYSNEKYNPIPIGYTVFERLENYFSNKKIITLFFSGKRNNLGGQGPHLVCVSCVDNNYGGWDKNKYWKNDEYLDYKKNNINSIFETKDGDPYFLTKDKIDFYKNDLGASEDVTKMAFDYLDKYKQNDLFMFLHYAEPDKQGHNYDENSQEYTDAIVKNDILLEKLVVKLKELGIFDKTIIYLTTDHGMDEGKRSHKNAPETFFCSSEKNLKSNIVGDRKDITPTILERFGLGLDIINPRMEGNSLLK